MSVPPPVAGTTTAYGDDTAEKCLRLEQRPETPTKVRRWRKSKFAEPGLRVIHPGLQLDLDARAAARSTFGKIKIESDHVEDVWRQSGAESEFAYIKEQQRESVYHSVKHEPLGKSLTRGHSLPEVTKTDKFRFGKQTASSDETAKALVYAPSAVETKQHKTQYVKSHGAYEPGEQRKRQYDWKNKDLTTHRFGSGDGSHVSFNGLSLGTAEVLKNDTAHPVTSTRVQCFKNLQPKLGRSRALGHATSLPVNHIYGKSTTATDPWDARACIQGEFSHDDQQPDEDLGTTLTPGFRNTTNGNRIYGVPTVRSDIPKYSRRSIADSQNYGDDVTAQQLLYPSRMLSAGLDETELTSKPRSKEEVREIFATVGTDLTPPQLDALYDDIACENEQGVVTLDAFRRKLLSKSL